MTPLDAIRAAAEASRERESKAKAEGFSQGHDILSAELGQWREAVVRACVALDKIGDNYEARMALAAVAEKLRRER